MSAIAMLDGESPEVVLQACVMELTELRSRFAVPPGVCSHEAHVRNNLLALCVRVDILHERLESGRLVSPENVEEAVRDFRTARDCLVRYAELLATNNSFAAGERRSDGVPFIQN